MTGSGSAWQDACRWRRGIFAQSGRWSQGRKRRFFYTKTRDNRLWRRVSQLEKLPAKERKQIVQLLDTFLEREKLKEGQVKQAGR